VTLTSGTLPSPLSPLPPLPLLCHLPLPSPLPLAALTNGLHFASPSVHPLQVAHVGHITATDCLLSGVGFCGGVDRTHVACAAYDVAALQAWRLD
jgi:hypothetical protein